MLTRNLLQHIMELEMEMKVLKDMLRGQRAETRTREIQNSVLRRKTRLHPGETPKHSRLPPIDHVV